MSLTPYPGEDTACQEIGEEGFTFACHPQVSCFNQCCARLTLGLSPYDVIRLKKALGLGSQEFLDRYTEAFIQEGARLPQLLLAMRGDETQACPFVGEAGCAVYEDRPGACRLYPLGRGAGPGGREEFVLVREPHCRGFEEARTWTPQTWMADQDALLYNKYNDMWMEVALSQESLGEPSQLLPKQQMFYLVSYNLDRFRAFVFETKFLARFVVSPDRTEQIKTDDLALFRLGLDWLKFALFGKPTMNVRE